MLGIVLFVPGFFANFGITMFKFISPLSYPLNLAGIIVASWYVIGVALVIYLAVRHPARVRATATVLEEATIALAPAPQGGLTRYSKLTDS